MAVLLKTSLPFVQMWVGPCAQTRNRKCTNKLTKTLKPVHRQNPTKNATPKNQNDDDDDDDDDDVVDDAAKDALVIFRANLFAFCYFFGFFLLIISLPPSLINLDPQPFGWTQGCNLATQLGPPLLCLSFHSVFLLCWFLLLPGRAHETWQRTNRWPTDFRICSWTET